MNPKIKNISHFNLLKNCEIFFADAQSSCDIYQESVHLIGFEFDGTACFRKGAVLGPLAIRKDSHQLESYSPYLNLDCADKKFYDLGNLTQEGGFKGQTDQFLEIFRDVGLAKKRIKILTLGGEHSISYGAIKSYLKEYQDLVVIHLDAHADLRDGYEGYHYSHASIIRRVLDHFKEGNRLIQYGIRSGTKEEYQWMRKHKTLYTRREDFLKVIDELPFERPIYLTCDLDYFDPCFLPGTGTPETGGEDFHSFISLMKILKNKNFVGADIVELAPNIDGTGNSSIFAAKVVREVILGLDSKALENF